MLYMPAARSSVVTGGLLRELVRTGGVAVTRDATRATAGVSYGVHIGTSSIPWLNAQAGSGSKFAQFERMRDAGVLVPGFQRGENFSFDYPILGRAFNHRGGTDIKLYLQRADLRTKGLSDFYVKFVPSVTEYRHWIYRGRHLGTYEKVLTHPEMQKRGRIGRNYAQGYAFELVHQERLPVLAGSIDQAKLAVEALGLDFGAADVLMGEDERPFVLEINTGPGVEDNRRQVIQALAEKIIRWVSLGYPRRRGVRGAEQN